MAIPKKKARNIVVNNEKYRWSSSLPGVTGDLTVTIVPETGERTPLIVKGRHTDPWYRLSVDKGSPDNSAPLLPDQIVKVTPAFVRSAILHGRSIGWDPTCKGAPIMIRYCDGSFQREEEP